MSATDAIPQILPDDRARARRSDPATSHKAADSNTNRGPVEAHVLALFKKWGTLTDDELDARYFKDPEAPAAHRETPRKRRSDLTEKGIVVAFGDATRKSLTGRPMQVYGLAEEVNA